MTEFAPMLAHSAAPGDVHMLVNDDEWVITQKVDGERRVFVAGAQPYSVNRRGERAATPAHLILPLTHIGRQGRSILDGELLGRELWLFDLVNLSPWDERQRQLIHLIGVRYANHGIHLLPAAVGTDAKVDLIERLQAGRAEGFVAKKAASRYRNGNRSHDWLKVKFRHTVDCEVVELGVDKQNMTLAVYDNGRQVEIGECTRLAGDGPRIKVGDVATVTYLYCTSEARPRLVQPTRPIRRTDKTPAECTIDQLHYTDKRVLLPS